MNASKLSSFRLFSLVALPLTALLAFAACDSPKDVVIGTDKQPIACNADADCPSNEPCVAGFCDSQSGTTGSGNGGSGNGGTSLATGGIGVVQSTGSFMTHCNVDADCPHSTLCVTGTCYPIGTSGSGMGGAQSTGSGVIQCVANADCPPNELCVNGTCGGVGTTGSGMILCMSNADCSPMQTCVGGVCKP
jgi:hypothetical protein